MPIRKYSKNTFVPLRFILILIHANVITNCNSAVANLYKSKDLRVQLAKLRYCSARKQLQREERENKNRKCTSKKK